MNRRNEPELDFVATLEEVNRAGYDYTSEWLADLEPGGDRIARFTAYKGKQKKGEWYGAKPSIAARRACDQLGIRVRYVVTTDDPTVVVR